MMSGVVTAYSGGSMTVQGSDGSSASFSVDPSVIQAGSEKMDVGDNVSVYYNGLLGGAVAGAPVRANRVAISGWGGNYVEGFVAEVGGGYAVVQIADHNYLRFSYDGSAGLATGDYVKVFYWGTINEGLGKDTLQSVSVHGYGATPAPAQPTTPVLTPGPVLPAAA